MPHHAAPFRKDALSVAELVNHLRTNVSIGVEVLTPEVDLQAAKVTESYLHRPGLALSGFVELYTHQRVQILGNTECAYLRSLDAAARREAVQRVLAFPVPCFILTHGNKAPKGLAELTREAGVALLRTPEPTTEFMALVREFLQDQFALQRAVHGALVDVYGTGLLLVGKPGIGKSEVALDLVERGHRLVADDVVIATRREAHLLIGSGTDLVQHFMEVRGLGLVDVRAMFGIRAIRFQKRIELVVHMHLWDAAEEYTRLGMVQDMYELLGVSLPMVKIPITPGKNITVICEVVAMNHLLRRYGYDPAEVFADRLRERIQQKEGPLPRRAVEYFEHDFE
ncbi:MAG: HPr kinase/phosphorylase [Bacteroidetes bacterium]|jgi:HPr kinase/phosphorylase|nr:HPr kinase/phosphorylase [Bacteroidota bacterium]